MYAVCISGAVNTQGFVWKFLFFVLVFFIHLFIHFRLTHDLMTVFLSENYHLRGRLSMK